MKSMWNQFNSFAAIRTTSIRCFMQKFTQKLSHKQKSPTLGEAHLWL